MNLRSITARSLSSLLVLLAVAACRSPELASGRAWLGVDESGALGLQTQEEPGRPPERAYRTLTAGERDALAGAQALDPGLAELRAGDVHLSDREVKIILITVGAVILLVILL